jgi:hypothetical protein
MLLCVPKNQRMQNYVWRFLCASVVKIDVHVLLSHGNVLGVRVEIS